MKRKISAAVLAIMILMSTASCETKKSINVKKSSTEGSRSLSQMKDNKEIPDGLLEIMSESEKKVNEFMEEYGKTSDITDVSNRFITRAELCDKTLKSIEIFKEKAEGFKDLGDACQNMRDNYFELVCGSLRLKKEVYSFMGEYFTINYTMPELKGTYEEYFSNIESFYEERRKEYEGINSIPDCIVTEWDGYKKCDEVLKYSIDKYKGASKNNDWLKIHSARNLAERFRKAEEVSYNSFIEGLKRHIQFSDYMISYATKIYEELVEYNVLDDETKNKYEFKNESFGKINLYYYNIDTIYPALYNTYDAIFVLAAGSLGGTRDIVVEAEIPGFTQKYKQSFKITTDFKRILIKPPVLNEKVKLDTSKEAQIVVSIYEKNGIDLISTKTYPVKIMSINDVAWYGDEYGVSTRDNILCYLTPYSDSMDKLRRNAINSIKTISSGRLESVIGYQGNLHYYNTYIQAAGVMRALYNMGVRYDMGSFSLEASHQRVKFPDDVIDDKSGLCIETSLTVASALQAAGMHVLLVMPPGHAQVAVEVSDKGDGVGEYYLIETTSLDSSNNNDSIYKTAAEAIYKDSKNLPKSGPIKYMTKTEWSEYLKNCYVIDCNDSTVLGLTPLYQ